MAKNLKQRNPYVAGKAIGHDKGFVGRDDVIQLVEDELFSPDRNAVVIFGQRRIGKTSILLQLRRRLDPSLFLPVYFDLMDRANQPLGHLLHELAGSLSSEFDLPVAARESFDDEGVYFRRQFLPLVYEKLGEDQRPVMLLDEFDVLDPETERQLPQTAAGKSFWPYVRRLMEGEAKLGFVFVMGRKAEELSADVKAAFKAARYKKVSFLEEKDARDLIATAELQGSLKFTDQAVDRILKLTSCHPYFTQLLCQLLWDEAWLRAGSSAIPTVDAPLVDAVVAKAPEAAETICEWIWEGLPSAEKVIFSAVAQATENRVSVSLPELIETLQQHGIRILTRELETAPETLVKWEMLDGADGKYRFIIELMRRWVSSRKPLAKVKDELDRVVPLADTLYQSGDGFYRRGNLESAQTLLRQALTVNPNHLKARLLVGQVLVEQGKTEDAVRELDEAFRHDETAGRYALIRTLLLRGEELKAANKEDEALATYERVLELSPADKVATERRTAIWMERGEKALKQDRLDEATDAFNNCGATAKIGEVEARRKRLHLDRLIEQGRKGVREEQWAKAIDAYTELATLEPQTKQWKDALESAQVEQKFAKQYADGLAALESSDQRKAQKILLEILNARPDYKDAPKLLVRALQGPQTPPAEETAGTPGPWAEFGRSYAKAAGAVTLCLLLGILPTKAGVSFYLGAAAGLAVALALIEAGLHFATRKNTEPEPEQTRIPSAIAELSAVPTPEPPKTLAAVAGGKK